MQELSEKQAWLPAYSQINECKVNMVWHGSTRWDEFQVAIHTNTLKHIRHSNNQQDLIVYNCFVVRQPLKQIIITITDFQNMRLLAIMTQFSPNLQPHNVATGFQPSSATVVSAETFPHGTGTLRCLQKEMATYRH